jgi:hypothetical protein
MAWKLTSYIVNPDDEEILVAHEFYSPKTGTQSECKNYFKEHQESCEYFAAAVQEGRTIEKWEQIDSEDMPSVEAMGESEL